MAMVLALLMMTSMSFESLNINFVNQAQASCNWWLAFWTDCDEVKKKQQDYPCYTTLTMVVQVEVEGVLTAKIEKIDVQTGNRIDCVSNGWQQCQHTQLLGFVVESFPLCA